MDKYLLGLEQYMAGGSFSWIGFILVFILSFLSRLFVRIFLKSVSKLADRSVFFKNIVFNEKLGLFCSITFVGFIWFVYVHLFHAPESMLIAIKFSAKIAIGVGIIGALYSLSFSLSELFMKFTEKTKTQLDDLLVPLFSKTLRVMIIIFGVLVLLQNLGVNVVSVIAGLGLGGLALALAAKDTVSNFFGFIMILVDRPFRVGDWIVIEDTEGVVEQIGFRSTRIRTFYQSLVIVPNAKLANTSINNMHERRFRRCKFYLGVIYSTTPHQMESFMEGIKKIILANPFSEKETYYVAFDQFGDSSLNILVQCFFEVNDRKEELKARRILCMEILRLAEKLNIDFAFPTRTLHLESSPDKPVDVKNILSSEELKKVADSFGQGGSAARPEGLGIYSD